MSLTEVEALGDLLEAETSLQLEICQHNLRVPSAIKKRMLNFRERSSFASRTGQEF